jgi:predicted ATPase
MSWPDDSISAPDRTPLPLVGREREVAVLREHLRAALAGRGSLALIGGEAGIGKTALAEALCREAAEHGALVLVGRCYDLSETPPYGAFIALLRDYEPRDGLPPPALFAHWGGVAPRTGEAALYAQAQSFFARVAAQTPLILLLDDCQWADQGSLDFLRVLARSIAASAILILATYRTDAVDRHDPLLSLLPLLERESRAARVLLRPLAEDALTRWISLRYHLDTDATERLSRYLRVRSDGNPLFITQLLRAIEEASALRRATDCWELDNLDQIGVPAALQEIIDARLERLPAAVQMLLPVAAVIGQEVPLTLLAAVAQRDEEAIVAAVEAAVRAHLVEATADGERIRFVHALIREALYEGIVAPRRRIWHRKVGEVLAGVPGADPDGSHTTSGALAIRAR